jgi:hypothetical protein
MKFTFETDSKDEAQAIIGNLIALNILHGVNAQLDGIQKYYSILVGEPKERKMTPDENKLFHEIKDRITSCIKSELQKKFIKDEKEEEQA